MKIYRAIFGTLILFTACTSSSNKLTEIVTKDYNYVEICEEKALFGDATELKEKNQETISVDSDSSAYLQAFEKFCIALKINNDMLERTSETFSTPIEFKLLNADGIDISKTTLFADKEKLEKEIQLDVFGEDNVFDNPTDDFSYVITKEEPNETQSKNNIEVSLNKKVSESTLKEIALEIRADRKQYNKLWIFYYIPDMTEGMAWATTHFTPNLEVEIIGSTEIEDSQTSDANNIDGEIIGKWRSEKSLMGATLILFKDLNGKLQMRITFKDGSSSDSEITESKKSGRPRYDDDNGHGEYYILESNGNLGMYGNDGKFDEAVKIK